MPRKFQFTKLLTGRPCVRFLPGFDCFSPVSKLARVEYIYVYIYRGCDEKSRDSFGKKEKSKKRVNAKVMQILWETNRY